MTGTEDDVRIYMIKLSECLNDGTWEDILEQKIKLNKENDIQNELLRRIKKTPVILQAIGTDLQLRNVFSDIRIVDEDIHIKGTQVQINNLKAILNNKPTVTPTNPPSECMACLDATDEYGGTELFTLLCGHTVHAHCIAQFHKASFRISQPTGCPLSADCQYNVLTIREYSRVFGMAIQHMNDVSKHLAVQNKLVTQTCRDCSDTLTIQSNVSYGTCTGCGLLQCLLCKEDAHFWCSCDELKSDTTPDSLTNEEIGSSSDNIVKCANCPALIMRDAENDNDERCRYMLCEQCGYEFCWLCLMEANNHKHFDRLNPQSEVQCDPSNRKTREISLSSTKRLYLAPSSEHVSCSSCDEEIGDSGYQCAQCINTYLCQSCNSKCPCSTTHNPKAIIPLKKQQLTCQKSHKMRQQQSSTAGVYWSCDRCNMTMSSSTTCRECDFDLCETCTIHSSATVTGIKEDRHHFIIVNGYLYSTLADVPVDGAVLTTQVAPLRIPDGWELAPYTFSTANVVAGEHPWSCEYLVIDSGRLLSTEKNSTSADRTLPSLVVEDDYYSPTVNYSHILIRRPVAALSIPPSDIPIPDMFIEPREVPYNELAAQLIIGRPLV